MIEEDAYERRKSVADIAYAAERKVDMITLRFDTHEKICGQRYDSLQGWLKTTFFTLLTSLGILLFYIITHR